MNCEYCGRTVRHGDIIHGIRYGTLTSTGFQAAPDSAVTVICGSCGKLVYQCVYSSLDNQSLAYPVIFKMVNELTLLMKNSFKMIQNIARLPAADQKAIKRLIALCEESH